VGGQIKIIDSTSSNAGMSKKENKLDGGKIWGQVHAFEIPADLKKGVKEV